MFGASRIVALILAFCLGFSLCGGMIVGGAVIALTEFRVRDIEKYHLADIPDELFMGDNPKVDLLNLSAFEFIKEMKTVYAMDDELTINTLQERYDLKFPASADKFLTEEARNIPIKSLFSEAGVKELLSSVYIGYIQSFECHALDSNEPADPALGKGNARWYNPTTGQYITGLNETLAFISIGGFISGKVDIQGVIGDIQIGEALSYYSETDPETGKVTWYDSNGDVVTGVMAVFAGCKVNEVGTKINDVKIGELLGYVQNDDGEWCEENTETGELEPITGVMKVFADCEIDEVGDEINEAKLGDLLGYTQDENGVWCETNEETGELEPVSGFMKILADSKMDNVGKNIEEASLGELFGYVQNDDGEWCEENTETGELEPVTGFMKVLADSQMDSVGKTIEEADMGDLLGYIAVRDEDGNVIRWEDSEGEEVTGIMKIVAGSKMDNVGSKIEESDLGDLMGYHKIGDKWYEENTETGELEPVDSFMTKIANSKMDSLGNVFTDLTIGDMVDEDERDGIFSILDPETPLDNIAGSINDSITDSPLQFYMNEGLVSFEPEMQTMLDGLSQTKDKYVPVSPTSEDYAKYYDLDGASWTTDAHGNYLIPEWRTVPLSDSFGYIIELTTPDIPISE